MKRRAARQLLSVLRWVARRLEQYVLRDEELEAGSRPACIERRWRARPVLV